VTNADDNPVLSPGDARQLDRECDRFEAAWKSGIRPDPADALAGLGEPRRSALLRQLLLLDWEYRSRAGEEPRPADYHARFPADGAVVDAVACEMSQATEGTRANTGDAGTPWAGDHGQESADDAVHAGTQQERYELLDEVGRGGIGVVFRGRDRVLGRSVAVKVLAEPLRDRPDARRRFFNEVRVGSRLQHPAIVPVYEVGRSHDGRPLFTMKLVEGRTLAALLKDRTDPGRDLPRLLAVFEQVSQAIAYAHEQGIVHRDLKPANVMVGAFGEVQVMDWGFAKVLSDSLCEPEALGRDLTVACASGPPSMTRSGALMGTPSYMPPEQALGESELVDARSDVFALGGILCEMLTGGPPYVADSPDEVCGKAAAADLADAHSRLNRCAADAGLRDLARRCLSADRSARPADGGAVARAITDYLASSQDRLRQAQLERAAAEARATAERRGRRIAVGLAAALLLGIGVAVWQAAVANRAKHDALAAAAAEMRAREATGAKEAETQAVLDFVEQRIIAPAAPTGQQAAPRPGVTVLEAVRAAAPVVDKSFKDQPLTEARLRLSLGRAFSILGDYETALRQSEAARAIYTRLLGVGHRDTLMSMDRVADSYLHLGRENGEAALKLNEETLALRRAYLGPDDHDTLSSMNNLAMCYFDRERYREAIELLEETVGLKTAKYGAGDRSTLTSMTHLANCYHRVGRLPEAIKLRKVTLALQRANFSPEDRETVWTMSNLAADYRKDKKYADALGLDEEALALRTKVVGPNHPETLMSMWGQAEDLINLGHGAEAVPILDECLRRAVGKRVHRRFFVVADLRLRCFEKANDAAGCRATAELWEQQKRTDDASLYQAAVCRAVTAKVIGAADHAAAAAEADRAMDWLKKALAAGYRGKARPAEDADLAILRDRPDFKALLVEPKAAR
jgi:tRNA A-37 threonylcarbamoyl transferase component Bud32/tetratricopeptide (TPR) repeat protein